MVTGGFVEFIKDEIFGEVDLTWDQFLALTQ